MIMRSRARAELGSMRACCGGHVAAAGEVELHLQHKKRSSASRHARIALRGLQ